MLLTPARPASRFLRHLPFLAIWLLTIMLSLVLPDDLYLFLGPYSHSHSAEGLDGRRWYSPFSNPAVQGVRCNAEKFCNLDRRIGRHIISGTLPVIVKDKMTRNIQPSQKRWARWHEESISTFTVIGSVVWCAFHPGTLDIPRNTV